MSDDDKDFMPIEELEDEESSNNANDVQITPIQNKGGRKCYSFVWRYFIKYPQSLTAECTTCHRVLSYKASVSNLGKHLRGQHPKLYKERFKNENQQLPFQITTVKKFNLFTSRDEVQATDDDDGTLNWRLPSDPDHQGELQWDGLIIQSDEIPIPQEIGTVQVECNCGTLDGNHSVECALFVKPAAWQYYDKIDLNTATCRLCQQEVEWGAKLESLTEHIQESHPSVEIGEEETTKQENIEQELIDENESDNQAEMIRNRAKKRKFSPKFRPQFKQTKIDPTKNDKDWNDSLERFGSYVASLMRLLPRERAAKYQVQIIERLVKESVRFD